MNSVPFYGLTLYCGDDPCLVRLAEKANRRTLSYGFNDDNFYQITNYQALRTGSSFTVRDGNRTYQFAIPSPGKHNALNATAAFAVSQEIGIPDTVSLQALSNFRGVQRRFQVKGEKKGVLFIDDYAHHPTEIRATISAARERFPHSKIRVLFQPHRFSRTQDLLEEFNHCFNGCDELSLVAIYAAGETPIEGINSEHLVNRLSFSNAFPVEYSRSALNTLLKWEAESKAGDVILTLGAGDLPNVYREIF
jgi:UDP-N-acetylmuramate--alanine ligase